MLKSRAKYHLGQVLRHRKHPFRGVVFDVDAMFSNTDEWYENIPEESRPAKDQPFYHLLAENDQSFYVAYVSEQNLMPDETGEPVDHPDLADLFGDFEDGRYPRFAEPPAPSAVSNALKVSMDLAGASRRNVTLIQLGERLRIGPRFEICAGVL